MKNQIVWIIALTLVQTACGDAKVGSSQYAYNYTENECSTGDKSADSQEALCRMLADNSQNRNAQGEVCADSIRARQLKEECPGYQIHD